MQEYVVCKNMRYTRICSIQEYAVFNKHASIQKYVTVQEYANIQE